MDSTISILNFSVSFLLVGGRGNTKGEYIITSRISKGGISIICIPPFCDEISISADMRFKSRIHNTLKII